jgi:hypothetical protein
MKIFGIGMPKTGTTSLSQMFIDGVHEYDANQTIKNIMNGKRVTKGNHLVDVASFNVYLIDQLLAEYPYAKFILTYREPKSWIESLLSHHKNIELCRVWKQFIFYRFGNKSINECLDYWCFHNKTVLDKIPNERLLKINVKNLSTSYHLIGEFTGMPVTPVHVRKNENKKIVVELENIPDKCKSIWERLIP